MRQSDCIHVRHGSCCLDTLSKDLVLQTKVCAALGEVFWDQCDLQRANSSHKRSITYESAVVRVTGTDSTYRAEPSGLLHYWVPCRDGSQFAKLSVLQLAKQSISELQSLGNDAGRSCHCTSSVYRPLMWSDTVRCSSFSLTSCRHAVHRSVP